MAKDVTRFNWVIEATIWDNYSCELFKLCDKSATEVKEMLIRDVTEWSEGNGTIKIEPIEVASLWAAVEDDYGNVAYEVIARPFAALDEYRV